MKHMFLAAAAMAVVAASPAVAATNFTVNTAGTSVSVTNNPSLCLGCNVSASLATFNPFSLNVGESRTFNFANYTISGLGVGSATVNAVLAFTDPFATSTGNVGSAGYFTFGGIISGGSLTWTNGLQTLSGGNGTQFSVRFNNLAGITTSTATSTVTVSLLAAAVPEPATWAMMLLGFGMVAGAARYRRARTSVTYA